MSDAGVMEPTEEFLEGAAALGVEFEAGDVERLGRFLGMMLEANRTTNLTAITEPREAWRKHLLDAMTLVPVVAAIREEGERGRWGEGEKTDAETGGRGDAEGEADAPSPALAEPRAPSPAEAGDGSVGRQEGQALRLVDIGSGGGVPGVPVAIVMPDVRVTLVEATGKKVEFLRRVVGELGLKNVEVVQGRAEGLGQDHKGHRERYDVATARALGHLAVVAELAGPLVRPRGYVVAVKGAKAEQEVGEAGKALGLIGLRHAQTVETPTGRLVVLEKTIRTPRLYPRRDGEPARVPLGVARK